MASSWQTTRHLRDRRLPRALLQFFKPQNYFEVRKALAELPRPDVAERRRWPVCCQPDKLAARHRGNTAHLPR